MPLFEQKQQHVHKNILAEKYIVNPFSILKRASSAWKDRKHYWEDMGIASKEGRETKRYNAMPYNISAARDYNTEDTEHISMFDPTLCELMYKWFSKEGDKILDPFAGGSVRGIIASILGRNYIGIDLSQKQVIANWEQYDDMSKKYIKTGTASWISGDSEYALDKLDGTYQMLFTCPPYYNLEQYTRDVRDLSRQATYDAFLIKYTAILNKAFAKLDMNAGAFVVIVVSEIRNFKAGGEFYGLVPDTINICRNAGLKYYNEIILEDPIGSLPLRGPQYFEQSRKVGRTHQNVLVFYAGDLSKIREKCDSMNI